MRQGNSVDRARLAFERAVGRAQQQIREPALVGWVRSAGDVRVDVPGHPTRLYVTLTNKGTYIDAINRAGVPKSIFWPVLVVLEGNNYVIVATDYSNAAAFANLPGSDWGGVSHPLDAHSDVTVTTPADGEVLRRSAGKWVNETLDADDIAETATREWFTPSEATKLAGIETGADVTDAGNMAAAIIAQAGKTTPLDTDIFPGLDSADSYQIKEFSWANIKAALKTYFDTLYVATATLLGYALLAGRNGGQTLKGGTDSGDDLTLESTNHATKGEVYIQPNGGNVDIGGLISLGYKLGVQSTSGDIAAFEVDGTFARMLFTAYRESASTHGLFKSQAARGSKGTPGVIQSGDSLFAIRAEAFVSAFNTGNNAEIAFEADGAQTGTSLPGRIVLRTTPAGSVTVVDAVYIDSSQRVGLGTSPQAKLHVLQPTLGSEVLRLQSTATADDPTEQYLHGRVATTGSAYATALTIPIAASNTYIIEVKIIGRRTGGTAGTTDDAWAALMVAAFRTTAGTVTKLGGSDMQSVFVSASPSGDARLTISGTNVLVEVAGAANNNITWHAFAIVRKVSS